MLQLRADGPENISIEEGTSFWVFVAAQTFLQLRQAAVTLWLSCVGFSLQRLLLLRNTGSGALRLQQLWFPSSRARAQ